MKKKQRITAFYIETLILVVVFITIILVLTRVFALSKQQSSRAEMLTNAVHLAENVAEAVSASGNEEELLELLDENGNAHRLAGSENGTFCLQYDSSMNPEPEGCFQVYVEWIPMGNELGNFVTCMITVCRDGMEESIYTLETAVYLRGKHHEIYSG